MPHVETIPYGTHEAHLEPFSGNGILVLPYPEHDLRIPGQPDTVEGRADLETLDLASLHEAQHDSVTRDLYRRGWPLTEGEDGWPPCSAGYTADGREAFGLYCLAPIHEGLDWDDHIASWQALNEAAGIVSVEDPDDL